MSYKHTTYPFTKSRNRIVTCFLASAQKSDYEDEKWLSARALLASFLTAVALALRTQGSSSPKRPRLLVNMWSSASMTPAQQMRVYSTRQYITARLLLTSKIRHCRSPDMPSLQVAMSLLSTTSLESPPTSKSFAREGLPCILPSVKAPKSLLAELAQALQQTVPDKSGRAYPTAKKDNCSCMVYLRSI